MLSMLLMHSWCGDLVCAAGCRPGAGLSPEPAGAARASVHPVCRGRGGHSLQPLGRYILLLSGSGPYIALLSVHCLHEVHTYFA